MTKIDAKSYAKHGDLIALVAGKEEIALSDGGESVWLEVIKKMDEVYADLIGYEADLERKNGELEAARNFIQSVIASVSDVLIVCDERGAILQVNPAFEELAGRDEAELKGASVTTLFVEEDEARAAAIIAGQARDPTSVELRFRSRKGPSDLMAINCSPLFDSDGRRAGAVFTGRPIGELRRAYEALHRAHVDLQQAQSRLVEQEKMASLGRLVAGVAHELNNPISFVYGNIHTLDRYRKAIAAYLEAIHAGASAEERGALRRASGIDAILADLEPLIDGTLEGAVRISEIVKNLRRLSFGAKTPREAVSLSKVVETAAQWASRSKKAKAKIVTSLETELYASGHSGQIHSVLVNLIDNALDAVREVEAPLVTIAMRAEGDAAIVAVADNGKGVPEALRSRIFEPFFTTKAVGEGTGLGLWISYSIAHEHGGSIEYDAPPEGGARFTLRLPRAMEGEMRGLRT
ncbi:MAG TPA: ATP-binding protein [Methylosinus sp.]|jgi:two-component system sensor histidine kinase HupT/HoxJ|uniref:sensor histidine kinase n=1 Tax=Methylosinus sp. TaxID=427 RepID=UPI002F9562B6